MPRRAPFRRPGWRRVLAVLAVLLALGATSGCAATNQKPGTGIRLTIGAQTANDNRVVAAIYGTALADQGYRVDYNWGVGSRTRIIAGLQNGIVDIVPDYTGLLLAATDSAHARGSPDVAFGFLQSAAEQLGLTVLQPADADKAPVYIATRAFATRHGIEDLSDLAAIDTAIAIGSADDLDTVPYGRRGLAYSYGVEGFREVTAKDDAEAIEDLRDNNTQVAVVSTLQPDVDDDDLVRLRDPRHIILDERIVPVVNSGRLDATIQRTLDAISRRLTTDDLLAFSRATDALPETTARAWLEKEHLLADG
ncbi:glycine betaine ABC transporter substrate-binding protein [Galbitalea sp. SE-J8]|uniref:glycine betaine ABC transporter substrate-binding protein n=1 Tax=Galbitalea sp. SE-J8 TaxID=3054952 RepID=UPI00259D0ADB|nr:glycine betaine ABC transporter substrate-binding protein [Galbitalea sp. SE-J8]MDM4761794.1 glycine betaine ABC transporter substrate-binding protein [Galbitalea sp. SE-J8]